MNLVICCLSASVHLCATLFVSLQLLLDFIVVALAVPSLVVYVALVEPFVPELYFEAVHVYAASQFECVVQAIEL